MATLVAEDVAETQIAGIAAQMSGSRRTRGRAMVRNRPHWVR
jgi:hypothetical protein